MTEADREAASAEAATEMGARAETAQRSAGGRPVEVELKFALADARLGERLLAAESVGPFTGGAPERATQIEDRYVDSADGGLARAGFAARLRQGPTGVVVGVKSRHAIAGALQRREELEGPADRSLDPHTWPASAARSLILELVGDSPLVELVIVRQLRRRRDLVADGSVVELSVDDVDVVARGRVVERFTELEVELRSGDEAALDELRQSLEREPGLEAARGSKFERALRAARAAGAPVPDLDLAAGDDGGRVRAGAGASTAGRRRERPGKRAGSIGGAATWVSPPEASQSGATPGSSDPRAGSSDPDAGPEAPRSSAAPGASEPGAPPGASEPSAAPGASEPGAADAAARESSPPSDAAGEAAPAPGRAQLVTGKTPGVSAEDTLAEAGRKVLRFHLARMIAREPGTRGGTDPEDLHSMRVATRRMRAAWRVFGDAYRPERTRRFRRHLREVAGRLGAVRDRDVLIDGLNAYRATLGAGESEAMAPLAAAWQADRDTARELLLRELDSDGYRRFVDEYVDFTGREGVGVVSVTPTEPHRIRDTAPSRMWAAYEQVRAYEPVLRWADIATLHQLRIAAKRLRYSLEFVRDALSPEAADLIARVVALQDHLGLMNDADVAATLARSFLVEHGGRLSEAEEQAIGRYLASREAEIQRLRRSIGPVWRRVAGVTFRRGLGRVTAAL
ncbi:MAG TPA: CHAD domain-containing protein [Candidatus Limnocylindrales bacterium]